MNVQRKTDVNFPEAPIPLRATLEPPAPIPVDALGPLTAPARAIATLTQAPLALGMQSVLGAANLCVQALADAETFVGRCPLSLFFFTIAASGERKSAGDKLAMEAIVAFERERMANYQAAREVYDIKAKLYAEERRKALKAAESVIETEPLADGPPPKKPLSPRLHISDFTYEGLLRHFEDGQPAVGIMLDEGGLLIGGPAMGSDNRMKTVSGLSKLWDGGSVERVRASAPPQSFHGRRASMHLMCQPRIAEQILSDEMVRDQGFLSRVLMACPESRIGSGLIRNDEAERAAMQEARICLDRFRNRLSCLLRGDAQLGAAQPQILAPRLLKLDLEAKRLLRDFANAVERRQREGNDFEIIQGVASKAAENAVRIAGTLTIFDDEMAPCITASTMKGAIMLMWWYLNEARRLLDQPAVQAEIAQAQKLLQWLQAKWFEDYIDRRTIVNRGPNSLRNVAIVQPSLRILQENGWLVPVAETVEVAGCPSRQASRVIRHPSWRS